MNNKIVARYLDGRLLKGIGLDINPSRPAFHVRPTHGSAVTVQMADLKAIFYVRSLDGDSNHDEDLTPDPDDVRSRATSLVTLRFADGEIMVGLTLGYPMNRPYFFIVPVDPRSNNIRILINRAALVSIEGAPTGEPAAQGHNGLTD